MRPLSASEAITPAFQRTKAVLFQPFQIGRSWKLAATAYLAVMGSMFVPTPLVALFHHPHGSRLGAALFQAILPLVILFACALMFVFFYIGARLQFVRFDIVLRVAKRRSRPSGRRYAPFTWRWIGIKLALSALFLVLLGAPLAFVLPRALAQLQITPGQRPAPGLFLDLFLLEAIFWLALFALMFSSSLLDDFLLPSIALEGVSLREAFRRFDALLRSEPGALLFYAFFKAVLALACGIAMEIGIVVTECILAIPLLLVGFLGWLMLHTTSVPPGHLLMATGVVLLGLAFAAILTYVTTGFIGAFVLFLQAYALYFLAGRYPMLGDPAPSPSRRRQRLSHPAAARPSLSPIIATPVPPPRHRTTHRLSHPRTHLKTNDEILARRIKNVLSVQSREHCHTVPCAVEGCLYCS